MPAAAAAPDRTEASCLSPIRTAASGTQRLIAEGIDIAHAALARDQLGEYQAQAAIAALHADAPRVEETDWVQIVEWYDELLRFADTPIVRLNRAVAVGEADGAPAGLAALAEVDEHRPGGGGRRPPLPKRRPPPTPPPPLHPTPPQTPNTPQNPQKSSEQREIVGP